MKFTIVREWNHTDRNARKLLLAEDGNHYLVSWVHNPMTGNQTLIVPAKEDGSAIEWTDVVEGILPTDALAKFAALSAEEVVRRLDWY
jgi:hypothetical protein